MLTHQGRQRSNQGESNKHLATGLMKRGVGLKTFNKHFLFLSVLAVFGSHEYLGNWGVLKAFILGRYLNSHRARITRESVCLGAINGVTGH